MNRRLVAVLGLLAACGDRQEPAPPAPPAASERPAPGERLLEVDGLVVTFGDLQPFVDYLDELYPRHSYRSKVRTVLDRHWLPVLLARRAFAVERREQEHRARTLADLADNVYDLETRGGPLGGRRSPRPLARKEVELPVAAWLFDPQHLGGVSPALEVPEGFKVVAAHDLIQSPLAADDRVDVFQVPFFTHDMATFMAWLNKEKERVRDRVTYVHPDFRDALPGWLKAP